MRAGLLLLLVTFVIGFASAKDLRHLVTAPQWQEQWEAGITTVEMATYLIQMHGNQSTPDGGGANRDAISALRPAVRGPTIIDIPPDPASNSAWALGLGVFRQAFEFSISSPASVHAASAYLWHTFDPNYVCFALYSSSGGFILAQLGSYASVPFSSTIDVTSMGFPADTVVAQATFPSAVILPVAGTYVVEVFPALDASCTFDGAAFMAWVRTPVIQAARWLNSIGPGSQTFGTDFSGAFTLLGSGGGGGDPHFAGGCIQL